MPSLRILGLGGTKRTHSTLCAFCMLPSGKSVMTERKCVKFRRRSARVNVEPSAKPQASYCLKSSQVKVSVALAWGFSFQSVKSTVLDGIRCVFRMFPSLLSCFQTVMLGPQFSTTKPSSIQLDGLTPDQLSVIFQVKYCAFIHGTRCNARTLPIMSYVIISKEN